MKYVPPRATWAVSGFANGIDELEETRVRLVRAREAEHEMLRKLDVLAAQSQIRKAEFEKAMHEAREVQCRARSAYADWVRTLRAVCEVRARRHRQDGGASS